MTINYTTLLGLALPVTGTESGTWGDDVSLGITDYLDIAIAGTNNITNDLDITFSITNGSSAGSNIVASPNSTTAQYMQLLCTGARTAVRNINCPESSKMYVVNNSTSGGYSVVIRGYTTGPTYTTGVTVVNGEKCIVFWSRVASDFIKISSSVINSFTGILSPANGGTGINNGSSTISIGGSLTFSGAYTTAFTTSGNTSLTLPTSGTVTALGNTVTGSGSIVLATNPTVAGTGAITLPSGTTAQEPGSPVEGMIRYNSTTKQFEGYSEVSGTPGWYSVGGSSISNDTSSTTAYYPLFAHSTSGTAQVIYTSNTQYTFKPSTGELIAPEVISSNGFMINGTTVSTSYTIASGNNAFSVGPITTASGVSITVASGQRWVIV